MPRSVGSGISGRRPRRWSRRAVAAQRCCQGAALLGQAHACGDLTKVPVREAYKSSAASSTVAVCHRRRPSHAMPAPLSIRRPAMSRAAAPPAR
jgi:hypothetical protein